MVISFFFFFHRAPQDFVPTESNSVHQCVVQTISAQVMSTAEEFLIPVGRTGIFHFFLKFKSVHVHMRIRIYTHSLCTLVLACIINTFGQIIFL